MWTVAALPSEDALVGGAVDAEIVHLSDGGVPMVRSR
jgi:hypothetical protein